MKKIKFFASLLKERDWLEEMATQGWLLTDMTLGIIYNFKEIPPCEKVYEIERFAVSPHSTIADLTARTNAISLAKEFGWEVATHDEDMNYYFVKDKAGDESDEFYDNEETRKERAERYRNRLCIEHPHLLAKFDMVLTVFYLILIALIATLTMKSDMDKLGLIVICVLLGLYSFSALSTTLSNLLYNKWGNQWYKELCMTRAEWENYKNFTEKKSFGKVQHLRSYLQEKSEFGLSFIGYEGGVYQFEEDTQRYNYFIDTKKNLLKRMKKAGVKFTAEAKDLFSTSLKWYETSIADAAQYDLKPVAVINQSILVYKRPYSDKHLPWENGNETIGYSKPTSKFIIAMLILFLIGFCLGTVLSHII